MLIPGKRVEWSGQILAPGEYSKVPEIGAYPAHWHACSPNGEHANLSAHDVTEHEDGTITVSPSIGVFHSMEDHAAGRFAYHGYLERGMWREC